MARNNGSRWVVVAACILWGVAAPVANAQQCTPVLTDSFPRPGTDVVLRDNFAYVAAGNDFLIIDISNLNQPVTVAEIDYPEGLHKVDVDGDYAYVRVGYDQISIISVSDPTAAHEVNTIELPWSWSAFASDVHVVDGVAYIMHRDWITVMDVSDPMHPSPIGKLQLGLFLPVRMEYMDGKLVLFPRWNRIISEEEVLIIDVQDPSAPFIAGSIRDFGLWRDLEPHHGQVYAVGNWGMERYDISDPTAPFQNAYTNHSWAYHDFDRVAVGDAYTYAQSGRWISVISVVEGMPSPVINMVELPQFVDVTTMTVDGDVLCLTTLSGGIMFYDISDAKSPVMAAQHHLAPDMFYYTAFKDNIMYALDEYNGLYLADVTDDREPRYVDHLTGLPSGRALAVNGEHLYVLYRQYAQWPEPDTAALGIYDVTDARHPERIGTYVFDAELYGMHVSGSYVYAYEAMQLQILDVSDPVAPMLANQVELPADTYDVCIDDGVMYLACGRKNLVFMNVSDPVNPVRIGESYDAGWMYALNYWDGHMYVRDDATIRIVDVRDPLQPVVRTEIVYDSSATPLLVVRDMLVVRGPHSQLHLYNVTDPSRPYLVANHYGLPWMSHARLHKDRLYAMQYLPTAVHMIDVGACLDAIACPEDANHDGVVDACDFFDLLQHWGDCPPQPALCTWDTSGFGGMPDQQVAVEDFFALLQRWGPCPE